MSNLSSNGTCFYFAADGITLDCDGYNVTGNGTGSFINATGYDSLTVVNCNVEHFSNLILANHTATVEDSNVTFINNYTLNLENVTFDNVVLTNVTEMTINGTSTLSSIEYYNNSILHVYGNATIEDSTFENNVCGLYYYNGTNKTISGNIFEDNSFGLVVEFANATNITANKFINSKNLSLNISGINSTIYNNLFRNDSGKPNVVVSGTHFWNVSYHQLSSGTNIVGNSYMGGNYWSGYTGVDNGNATNEHVPNVSGDFIGDTLVPYNDSTTFINDSLPLIGTPDCQEVTSDLSMTADLYVDSLSDGEACYLITGDNLVFDLGGFTIEGDSEGYAIKVQDAENVTIINGIISGFEIGVYIDPSNNITVNNVTINISDYGIRLEDTTDSLIVNNTIYNISYTGLDIINSTDNLVYNNIINVTDCSSSCTEYNVYQDSNSSNSFNVTYQPGTNILGGNMSGGNYYGNYAGIDSGSGFGNYSVQGDMVGDTQVPYQINDNLDYFPLTNDDGEGHSNCISITEDTALNTDIFCDEDEAVYIAADNVLLDCNGHSITGSGSGSGIKSIGYNNITIRECNISNFYYGINIQGGSVINIDKENVITDNSFYGIYMVDVNDTTITNTSLERDNNGIYVVNGSYVNVTDNLIALNKKFYGVFMFDSDNVYVHSNDFSRNYHGSYFVNVDGASVQYNTYDDHDYFASYSATFSDAHTYYKNTFNDARTLLRVYQNVSGITVKNNTFGESSQYALRFHGDIDDVNMSGNTFNGSTSKVSTAHIMLSDIDNLNLTDNNFSSDLSVMQVGSSTNVQSINNTYTSNGSVGFADVALLNIYGDAYSRLLDVDGASDLTVMNITSVNVTMVDIVKSTLAENLFTNNTLEDTIDVDTSSNIQLSYSSADTMVVSNTDYLNARFFDLNTTAVLDSVLGEHFRDIDIQDSNKTAYNFTDVDSMNIVYNVLRRNAGGILLQGDSDGNIIAENWIEDNGYGLNITSSDSNTIKDNYFDNTENVDDTGSNTWYGSYTCSDGPNIVGGPCKGGNFYNDFYGLDNGYSGGVEGDGISDQPTRYNVDSDTYDELPLMLYVSRVYYAPSDSATASLTATASYTGTLEDGEIVPNVWQYITYSSSYPIWRFRSLFNETDFNASTFVLSSNGTNTYFNFSGITDLGNTAERSEVDYATVMLQHQQRLNGGVCIDWNATGLEPDSCDKRIKSMGGAMNASANSSHYLVNFNTAPVVNRSGVAYVDFNMTCGAHIYHDITLTEDVSCNQSAFIVKADNIVIDLNGNELIGNGSGIGVNISDYDNVTLTGGTVSNFTTAVYVDPAVGINISGMTIADSFIGVNFSEINNSYITSNTFLRLNRSVQLVESDHNQIFDNTFVNGTVGVRVLASDNLTLENNVLYNFVTEAMYLNLIDGVNITNVSIYNSTNGITVRNTGSLTVFKLLFNGSDGIPLMMYKVSGSNLLNNTFNHSTTTVTFDAVNSTVMANNKAYNLKNYSVYFQNTTNVTLYNNLFNTTYPAYHDAHSNISWNTTLNCSNINILGGNCTGGNYWGSYDGWDVDLDGVGETLLPFNGSDTGAFGDMLPLTEVGEISCGGTEQNVTMNVTLNQDITVNLTDDETCFNLQTPAITFDCSGYSLIGNGTGMAVNMSAQNTFKNCIVSNFSIGATMVDHGTINRSVIKGSVLGVSQLGDAFILNSTIYDVVTGISRRDNNEGYIRGTYVGANDTCVKIRNISHAHFIQVAGNEFNCPIGVDITNASIRVYDNIFNTSNVSIISHNDTIFNSSYNCSRTNILGNNCTGGNWYSDYQDDGKDDGNGTYSGIPNISSDGIADNPVPYNASGNITLGGDYLPLLGNYTSSLTSRLAALTNDDDSSDDSSSDDDGGDGDSGSSGSGSSGGGGSGSSSSSSSSGGGGGSSYTLTSDDCTQEWECDDWSVCDDNFQVRDCTDANNCFEEYGLGNFVRKEKPEEEQWCPGDFSDTETVPEQIVVTPPQVIVQQEEGPVNMTLLLASGIGGFTFLGGLFIGYDLIAPHRRLRRRLRKIEGSVDVSSVDTLKSHYGSAYELYMRLSESKKQDYYGRVMSLRSQIEGQLLAEKRIENLIDLAKKSDKSTEKRKYYMRVYKMYESLSPVLQSKVYQKIVDLREELEGGKF